MTTSRPLPALPVVALFALSMLVALSIPATASATQVAERFSIVADGHQYHPDISGDVIVYQQKTTGTWNIHGHDLATHTTFPICTAAGDQILPSVSGRYVVWEDHRNASADIYGYDLVAHTEFPVCTDPREQRNPRVAGDWIVWQDLRSGNWDIYGWVVGQPDAIPIAVESHDQVHPDVSGDDVVWTDRRAGNKDILGYNRVADYTFTVCNDPAGQDQPAIEGDTVAWRDDRGGKKNGTDIYRYDLGTSTEFAVWTGSGDQKEPAVCGDLVVWTDGDALPGGSGWDIWALDTTYWQLLPVCMASKWQGFPAVDGHTAVWSDARSSSAADLHGAVLTPWFARLRINDGATWTRSTKATLKPYGRSKGGIVTQMALWNEGTPVGPWEPYATSRAEWNLGAGDGVKRVRASFADLSGGISPTVSDTITLDTHGPVCKVPYAVRAGQGSRATIRYRVNDNLAKQASVTIRVKNRAGGTVAILILGKRATNKLLSQGVLCSFGPGAFKIFVTAKDLAGNAQSQVGRNTLTVLE